MSDSSVSNPSFWSKWLTDELPHAKLVIKCLRNNWEGRGKTRLSAPGAHLTVSHSLRTKCSLFYSARSRSHTTPPVKTQTQAPKRHKT